MKKSILYFAGAVSLFFYSCGNSDQSGSIKTDSLSRLADTVLHTACFVAADQKDTANLSLSTFGDGKVRGHLLISFLDKGKNDGEVEGVYRGDTLFLDYTFKIGTTNKTVYKNPLALLKKENELVLGVGQIETSLGRSYFVKGKPISFEKGRFVFTPVDCKE